MKQLKMLESYKFAAEEKMKSLSESHQFLFHRSVELLSILSTPQTSICRIYLLVRLLEFGQLTPTFSSISNF